MARFLRTETNSSGGHSHLRGPEPPIVNQPVPFVARPVQVHQAADTNSRGFRTVARIAKSHLPQVPVVGAGIAFHGPGVRLADPLSPNRLNRRAARPHLSPPAVVTPAPVFTAPPVEVKLAPSTRLSRGTHSRLPQVVYAPKVYAPSSVFLTKPRDTIAPTHSFLRAPVVVTPESTGVAPPIRVKLARIRPFPTDASVFKPVVVAQAQGAQGGIGIQLAPSFRGKAKSFLRAPVVVTAVATDVFFGPKAELAKIKPGRTISRLKPPVVVAPVLARPTATHLTYSSRGEPKARLAPPVVVAPVLARPVDVTLARIKPAPIHSVLRKPTDLVDQQDVGFVRVHLAYSRRGAPKSVLREPTVVAPVLARRIEVTLAPQKRGVPKSVLHAPTVVAPVLATPIFVSLAYSSHGTPKSRLFAPAVVATFVESVARPTDTTFAYGLRGKQKSTLRPPAVVSPVLASPISTTLVRIRPVATRWLLRRPVDLVDRDDLGTVRVHLAYGLRGKAKPRLAPPTVVAPVLARPIDVTLVRIKPVRTTTILRKPVDLVDKQDVGSLHTHLAYSLRGKPKSRLVSPAVVAPVLDRPVVVSFAPSFRGIPKSRLEPPVVVAPVLARPLDTTFARIIPAPVHSVLRKPVDLVDQQDLGFVRVHLVRITPPPVHSVLRKPVAIDLRPQTYYLDLHLAYSRRGEPKSLLRPASLFTPQPKAETVLAVTLAYSLRGRPKSVLRRPVVVTPATPYLRAVDVTLAPQRRGKPKPRLAPPVVVARFVARPTRVELAPQRRGIPKSVLRKPVVVQTFRIPVISTTLARITPPPVHSVLRKPTDLVDTQDLGFVRVQLAPSRFPTPKSQLFPPTAVGTFRIPVVSVTLAPQARGKTTSVLRKPVVVAVRGVFFGPQVALAYQSRGKAKSRLLPPAVLRIPFFAPPVSVSLTRIRPVPTVTLLRPPAVIGAGIAFFGPKVTLVRIRPRPTVTILAPPTVIDTECFGSVVGFDFSAEVCGSDEGATVQGASAAGGSVTGSDEKREGC